jgi:putative PEP-CTERM system histidine kinase
MLLVILSGALELFDLLCLLHPAQLLFWKKFALVTEALLPPAWLWFSLTYSRQNVQDAVPMLHRFLLAGTPLFLGSAVFFPVTTFLYSPDFGVEHLLFLGNLGFFFYILLLVYLVIALINLEMTLMNATLAARSRIKLEILGAGALLGVMVFYYSQGLLFRTIDMNFAPARTLVMIVAVSMMVSSRLKHEDGVKVYVSRNIAYKSFVLVAVGIYLLGLGILGEGMKYFGDAMWRAMLVAAAFLGGFGLLLVLLSEAAKRRIKVFIHKNFYQHKYDYRNQWLHFTDRISSSRSNDDLLGSIVSGFCDTFGMECGAIFILDQDQGIYRQGADIAMPRLVSGFPAIDHGLVWLSGRNWVADLRGGEPRIGGELHRNYFRDNDARFLIPLLNRDNLDGFIIIGKPVSKNETYNFEDYDLMKTLARQASSTLLNLKLSDQLARSRELAAIGKVSTFVMHDLKNLVSTMSLMVENSREHIARPEFQSDLLTTLDSTVVKMNTLIQRLKRLPDEDHGQNSPVDLLKLAQETAAMVKGGFLKVHGVPAVVRGDRDELQKVALNLMLNAVEASDGTKPVTVEVGERDNPFLRVKDVGCGIPLEFQRHKLFAPFKTTKNRGLGIGLYHCKQIVEAHGGKIEVTSELNRGSEFTVWLQKETSYNM